jgi:hypothetical protein
MPTISGIEYDDVNNDDDDDDNDDDTSSSNGKMMNLQRKRQQHMGWSDQQRRILTANGAAEQWYCSDRGFAFTDNELPHCYILNINNTRAVFREWKMDEEKRLSGSHRQSSPIVGIWKRTLFYGGFEYTTDKDEYTFNVQTNTLFIDLRIPITRDVLLTKRIDHTTKSIESLDDMDGEQLRLYARQHIFAGYTRIQPGNDHNLPKCALFPYCATRYHCIDWNFIAIPRSRPNKWWVEIPINPEKDHGVCNNVVQQWKEWAYATDQYNQHYYCEHWQRLDSIVTTCEPPVLCLRKDSLRDGMLIVMGDHVMYCLDRFDTNIHPKPSSTCSSLVAAVDEAVLQNKDCDAARAWLSMVGGHGRWIDIEQDGNGSWILDHCIEFWMQGQPLFRKNDGESLVVTGTSIEQCIVLWNSEPWSVFDCNLANVEAIRDLLLHGPNNMACR